MNMCGKFDRKITYKNGEDPRDHVVFQTRRSDNASKVEWFAVSCYTLGHFCTLREKDTGVSSK